MDRLFRAVLEGENAEPGQIAATDVARLLMGVQTALRLAAHVVLGRPRLATTGRYGAVIEDATRLRLVRIEPGSFAGVLALPEIVTEPEELGVDVSMQDLGYRAFDRLLDVLVQPDGEVDPGLARAIGRLAEDVNVGGRTARIRLESLAGEQRSSRMATIDTSTLRAMELAAARPDPRPDTVHGRLVEADFETYKARLRQPTGEPVTVTFDEDLADDIQAALREPSVFAGDVIYDPQTGRALRIAVRRVIGPDEQLALPGLDFQEHRTVAELAVEQGVVEPQALDDLRATGIEADELAAFVAAAEQL